MGTKLKEFVIYGERDTYYSGVWQWLEEHQVKVVNTTVIPRNGLTTIWVWYEEL